MSTQNRSLIKKWLQKYWRQSLVLIVVAIMISRCVDISTVDQPATVAAGDTLVSVVHVHIPSSANENNGRLVVAFLAPKAWNAGSSLEMSYKITSSSRNLGHTGGSMSPVPKGTIAPSSTEEWPDKINSLAGIGGNKVRDLEWIVFWSDETYNIANHDDIKADVTIKVLTGDRDVIVDLGYFVASTVYAMDPGASNHAFDFKFLPLETTGGEGPLTNFLEPQLTLVNPVNNSDNDFITFTFDGSLLQTPLTGASKVFLCATAYTDDHQVIAVNEKEKKEEMLSTDRDRWRLDMWPRKYFDISENQKIDSIKYYFSDASGDSIVQQQKPVDAPFLHVFSCN